MRCITLHYLKRNLIPLNYFIRTVRQCSKEIETPSALIRSIFCFQHCFFSSCQYQRGNYQLDRLPQVWLQFYLFQNIFLNCAPVTTTRNFYAWPIQLIGSIKSYEKCANYASNEYLTMVSCVYISMVRVSLTVRRRQLTLTCKVKLRDYSFNRLITV